MRFDQTLLWLICFTILACAPGIKRTGYDKVVGTNDSNCSLMVAHNSEIEADSAWVKLGSLQTYELLSTNCSERATMKIIKSEGCGIGANLFVISSEERPSFSKVCYVIKGDYFIVPDSTIKSHRSDRYSEIEINKRVKRDNFTNMWSTGVIAVGLILIIALLD